MANFTEITSLYSVIVEKKTKIPKLLLPQGPVDAKDCHKTLVRACYNNDLVGTTAYKKLTPRRGYWGTMLGGKRYWKCK